MKSLGTVFNVPEQFKNCSLIKNKILQRKGLLLACSDFNTSITAVGWVWEQ